MQLPMISKAMKKEITALFNRILFKKTKRAMKKKNLRVNLKNCEIL
jgi:hypothetical protein